MELENLLIEVDRPSEFEQAAQGLPEVYKDRARVLDDFIAELKRTLNERGIRYDNISGRAKHIYSILNKYQEKEDDEVLDLFGVRVVVEDEVVCRQVMDACLVRWRPIPGRIKDYISNPKPEGNYRALHIGISYNVGDVPCPIELQVRSREMNLHAEMGEAAHWRYKLADVPRALRKDKTFCSLWRPWLKMWAEDFFSDRLVVRTIDNGKIVVLPHYATPIDLAFRLALRPQFKIRAKLENGTPRSMTTPLLPGEKLRLTVEERAEQYPVWWLYHVRTQQARKAIVEGLEQAGERSLVCRVGLELAVSASVRTRVGGDWLGFFQRTGRLKQIGTRFGTLDVFYREVAAKGTEFAIEVFEQTKGEVLQEYKKLREELSAELVDKLKVYVRQNEKMDFLYGERMDIVTARLEPLNDLGGAETANYCYLARCCCPVPGDFIEGILTYVGAEKIIVTHRSDCQLLGVLREVEGEARSVRLKWHRAITNNCKAGCEVFVLNRQGILADVTRTIADMGINIDYLFIRNIDKKLAASFFFGLYVDGRTCFEKILSALGKINFVVEAVRSPYPYLCGVAITEESLSTRNVATGFNQGEKKDGHSGPEAEYK